MLSWIGIPWRLGFSAFIICTLVGGGGWRKVRKETKGKTLELSFPVLGVSIEVDDLFTRLRKGRSMVAIEEIHEAQRVWIIQ